MATMEIRRKIGELNKTLRTQYNDLKIKKQSLNDHLSTLIKRAKQIQTLKKSLNNDLVQAQQIARAQRNKKIAYIGILESDMIKLNQEYSEECLRLNKLEDEYEVSLHDYDAVLKTVTAEIQSVKILESDILKQKDDHASIKAMIFDYEKLKRVLEEERNYLKEASSNEEKSHQQRMKELETMRSKLISESKTHEGSFNLNCYRSGLMKINYLYNKKLRSYSEVFIRGQKKFKYKTDLGIKIFSNCLQLGTFKHKLVARKLFYKWHHSVFPKKPLTQLVQATLSNDMESRKKIFILNTMIEKTNESNLYMFHTFQKAKFLSTLANKVGRKDIEYGFGKWRESYHYRTNISNKMSKVMDKVIPFYRKRIGFKRWRDTSMLIGRFERAQLLLDEFIQVKELSRIFRKWRLQIPTLQITAINSYIRNVKDRGLIQSRINYEKRKSKALTIISDRMTKVKIRNYFIKYWTNIKDLTVQKYRSDIIEQKQHFSELRAQNKTQVTTINKQNRLKSLRIFRSFMMNLRLRPVFRKWRNTNKYMKQRSQVVFHLTLRKEARMKLYIMNEFRRCVQYFEKKQMHQVLTDLNNKMEAINEKSTDFRNRLKNCIQELGAMASKKIEYIFNYSVFCQQRLYFDHHLRLKVKKLYNEYLLHRLTAVLNGFYSKKSLNELNTYSKNAHKQAKLKAASIKFQEFKNKMLFQKGFYGLLGSLKSNKLCFKKMMQSENVLMYYRIAAGFLALQRKSSAEKVKSIKKTINSNEQILETKKEELDNLTGRRCKLEQSLKKIFINFVNFENRNMELKDIQLEKRLIRRYFNMFRKNTADQIHCENTLLHFQGFLRQKNNFIFWKGATAIKYQNLVALVKEDLGQINRKKKAFQEKNIKGRGDIEKKLQESLEVYNEKKDNHDYYVTKYNNILEYYVRKHHKTQKNYYLREIFMAWKKEFLGTKNIKIGINKVYQRNLVYPAYQEILRIMKKEDSQFKSQLLCADILFRKAKNCMKDCLIIWRSNLRKMKCDKMSQEAQKMIEEREVLVDESKLTGELISNQCVRIKRQKLLSVCFMAMKTEVTQKIYLQKYQIEPFQKKVGERLRKIVMDGWKWLMFYKKTKRGYLKFTKEKNQASLKRDVFLSLKIYRQEHYTLQEKMRAITQNLTLQYLRFSLDKIINTAAYSKDQLNYQRKRALRHLVMNKVTRVSIIKKKILAKWHAWLIPKDHYLPVILKSCEVVALRRAFANIRERAYWHPIYVKQAADKITNEGYSEINNTTNNLVKQGFDPDEIKDYLTEQNEKDIETYRKVTNRIKVWGEKEDMVRAWSSWKQYLQIKGKIRKSMSKVMMISQGIGRYWNRWKKKDPEFNAILQKQSRGNMLERYRDLGRLLKEYKRDVKDSFVYCEQLKQINDQYAQKNEEALRLALSTFSSKLKVGLRQGMDIWRKRVRQYHQIETDRRYDQLSEGIQILLSRKKSVRERLAILKQENEIMKKKCNLGAECGDLLGKLLKQKDSLSIDLADKEHNMKLLLQDNLRLKQKIKAAKTNAEKLITQVQIYNQQE